MPSLWVHAFLTGTLFSFLTFLSLQKKLLSCKFLFSFLYCFLYSPFISVQNLVPANSNLSCSCLTFYYIPSFLVYAFHF